MANPIAMREHSGYNETMILSFAHKGLKKFFLTGNLAGIQAKHAEQLRLILAQLNQARVVEDMQIPALALHELKGGRKKTWAVTVQANWRITFRFENGDAQIVNYEDYH
jgi:proteic killer suppression protein